MSVHKSSVNLYEYVFWQLSEVNKSGSDTMKTRSESGSVFASKNSNSTGALSAKDMDTKKQNSQVREEIC